MERVLTKNTFIEEYVSFPDFRKNAPMWAKSAFPGCIYTKESHPWFVLYDEESKHVLFIYSKDINSE